MRTLNEYGVRLELRPYQVEAVEKMVERQNQLLAVIMGGGKTLTTIAAIETLAQQGKVRSGLVIVPNSLKFQWLGEIRDKCGALCQIIDGDLKHRQYQMKHAWRFRYNIVNHDVFSSKNGQAMMTTFMPNPDFVVIDEATSIKTPKAKRSRAIKKYGLRAPYRFALSGQPVENRPEELFSIMQFVDPEVLGDFRTFDKTFISRDNYGRPVRYRNLSTLHKAMEPAMFRRSRKDIEEFLPRIISSKVVLELDPAVQRVYDYIVRDTLAVIEELGSGGGGFDIAAHYGANNDPSGNQGKGEIMSRVTVMRMLCDHPSLPMLSAQNFDDPDSRTGSRYASELKAEGLFTNISGGDVKARAIVELVEEILDEDPNNRVVLFSFFKPMLRLLGQNLAKRKIKPVFLTGDLTPQERAVSLTQFRGPARVLLSSDAGQYGVDLPQANYLISVDLPWSAGAYAQRVARIDRISSQWPHVNVISMVMKGTIEERQYEMLEQKGLVAEAFIDGKHRDAKGGLTLTLDTLKRFLQGS